MPVTAFVLTSAPLQFLPLLAVFPTQQQPEGLSHVGERILALRA